MREVWADDDDVVEDQELTTRKWTESEEAALLKYWRENIGKYVTKTKRFFYDEAARIPELKHKTTAQIKSKCFDTEKRYKDTNQMLRAAGIAVNEGSDPDASRRWVLKKFSLYYDVHPFLSHRDTVDMSDASPNGAITPAKKHGKPAAPQPAGAPTTFLATIMGGKKRSLNANSVTPARVVSKRHREEIERFTKENEKIAIANANAAKQAQIAAAAAAAEKAKANEISVKHANPQTGASAVEVQENSAMVQAATEKMQAEAKLATIRANAALLRERKALLDEGIDVEEINALLPLASMCPSRPS